MKSKPLVTIITPSYNQGNFIEYTILSVLNQTYENIEYIVIDGASTDGTIEILNKYGNKIKYVSEPDKGQADAINKGFKMAKGEIIGWINSDDLLDENSIEKIISHFIEDKKLGICYGNIINIDETGNILSKTENKNITLNKLLYINSEVVQPGSFYKKAFVEKVNYLDDNLRYVMDFDLWIRILKLGNIKYVNETLAYFRLHANSKTVSEQDGFAPEIEKVLKRNDGSIYALPNLYLRDRYYMEWKERLIPKLKKAFKNATEKNIGIYGSGGHTVSMLKLYKDFFGEIDFNIYIFDSDNNKINTELLGFTIHSIDNILNYNLDRIIISSYSFQEQISCKVEEIVKNNIHIMKLYGEDEYIFFSN